MLLIGELRNELSQIAYPDESRHGYSADKLIREEVAFFVTRVDGSPAGCGGLKLFGTDYGEVKRMFVRPQFRGNGLGKLMLDRLTDFSLENNVNTLRLETGIYQEAAIQLYERYGFKRRDPFGEYKLDPLSVYFEKQIR